MTPEAALPDRTCVPRVPERVMRLSQLGAMFPTRLSFLRVLLRDLANGGARPDWRVWELDGDGFGHAVCTIDLDGGTWSLIAFADPLADADRSDRVIAQAWDACFVLFQGVPTADEIAAIKPHARTQEAGRYDERVHVLSRANKSVRLFEHVVQALAEGRQPDPKKLSAVGYLMRTTAVYGNGKFGMADRVPGTLSFRLEMLTVALIREFTLRLADHVAAARGGNVAVSLDEDSVARLGVGNATGLGMAPFLVNHPELLHAWMETRERALAAARGLTALDDEAREEVLALARRIGAHLAAWVVDDADENARIRALCTRWSRLCERLPALLAAPMPFDAIVADAEGEPDCEELAIALVLETQGDTIDPLCRDMQAGPPAPLDARMSLDRLRTLLDTHYGWADAGALPDDAPMAWYVSEDKLEPRFGAVTPAMQAHRRLPIDVARRIMALRRDLAKASDPSLPAFLMRLPHHRWAVRRAQTIAIHPYGEVRDDLVAADLRPVDLLRAKLSLFGAGRFDPRSDRWLRVTLFQGLPRLAHLRQGDDRATFFPALV